MVKYHWTLDDHRDHCLELAAAALTQDIRDRFLRVARLFEVKTRLLHRTSLQISKSKALMTTVEALLGVPAVRRVPTPEPRVSAPTPAGMT